MTDSCKHGKRNERCYFVYYLTLNIECCEFLVNVNEFLRDYTYTKT
jgi:hypothetical protein